MKNLLRLMHDFQWLVDPESGLPVASRMDLPDWPSGFNLDAYPQVVPLWVDPKGGEGAYKLSRPWAQRMHQHNPDPESFAKLIRPAAGLINPRGGQDGLPADLSQYDGETVAEGIGSGGNVYEWVERKNGSVRLQLIDFQSTPDSRQNLDYWTSPTKVNAFTAITKSGDVAKCVGRDVFFFNLGKPGAGWVPEERVEYFPELPMEISVTTGDGLNLRSQPSTSGTVVKKLQPGQLMQLLDYQPRGSDVWGEIQLPTGQRGFVALVYSTPGTTRYQEFTSWHMQTRPPLAPSAALQQLITQTSGGGGSEPAEDPIVTKNPFPKIGKAVAIHKLIQQFNGDPVAICNYLQAMGYQSVVIKIGNGLLAWTGLEAFIIEATRRGIRVWGYWYLYGYDGEENVCAEHTAYLKTFGLVGLMLDVEGEWDRSEGTSGTIAQQRKRLEPKARNFMTVQRAKLPTFPIALASHWRLYDHATPVMAFLEKCDLNCPQNYSLGNLSDATVANRINASMKEYEEAGWDGPTVPFLCAYHEGGYAAKVSHMLAADQRVRDLGMPGEIWWFLPHILERPEWAAAIQSMPWEVEYTGGGQPDPDPDPQPDPDCTAAVKQARLDELQGVQNHIDQRLSELS